MNFCGNSITDDNKFEQTWIRFDMHQDFLAFLRKHGRLPFQDMLEMEAAMKMI